MGPHQMGAEVNSGYGRSDYEADELAVARTVARANDATRARAALLPSLISAGFSFRPRRWWSRAPFLPLPDSEYTRWRLYTAYGDEAARPPFPDIVGFAVWRQGIRRVVEMGSQ